MPTVDNLKTVEVRGFVPRRKAPGSRQFPKFSMHYLYILKSECYGTSYTGVAKDIGKRLEDHNRGRVKSTKHKRPWILIHSEAHETLSDAKKREWFLKCTPQGGKLKKKILETA